LNITAKDMSEKVVPDLFPIPMVFFKIVKRSVCPVYSAGNELIFDKLKDFDPGKVDDLIAEGKTHLYVNKLERLAFVHNVNSELMTLLTSIEISPDEEITAADKSLDLLSRKLLTIGLNEETIKLANKNMELMKKNVKMYPKLAKLLDRLL